MARLGPRSPAAIVLIALATSTIRAQAPQTPADGRPPSPVNVTAQLARQGVKAGVVMCYDAEELSQAACEDLNVSLFRRMDGGVLHVRTMGEPQRVTDLLNRSIRLEPASGVPAIEIVATRIVNALRGDHSAGPHGATGAPGQLVTLHGGSTTVIKALDEVVRQAPGLVWYLYFSPKDEGGPLAIGLVGPGGGSGTIVFPLLTRE